MPKTTKYVPRKRTRKFTKRKSTVKTLASKVNKLLSSVEHKYFETGAETIAPDNLPTVNYRPYANIVLGTTDRANRIGDKINVSSFQWKSVFTVGAASVPPVVRIVAFIYKNNPDGIAASFSTIINLYLDSSYMNSELAVLAPRDYDNRNSFVTLYDQKRTITHNTESLGGVHQWDLNLRIPKKYQNVQYVNGSAAVVRNELIIAVIQEQDTGLSFNYAYKFFFTDA